MIAQSPQNAQIFKPYTNVVPSKIMTRKCPYCDKTASYTMFRDYGIDADGARRCGVECRGCGVEIPFLMKK